MTTGPKVHKLLAEIEPELIRMFPLAARAANVAEPVYALILCYIDTTTDDYMPFVVVAPERVRRRAVERKGNDASWMIWSPHQQLDNPAGLLKQRYLEGASLKSKIHACYQLLTDHNDSGDDDAQLKPFREMMWRVARTLNNHAWQGILDVTDDFAVVASDWSGFWVKEDATNSLPPKNRLLLESRKLFFHEQTDDEQAEIQRHVAAVEAELASRTESERVAFWIDNLARLSSGQRCLLSERRWNESVAVDRLVVIGGAASLPLLDLAARLDAMPPQDTDGQRSTASEVLEAVFSTVGDISRANSAVENRLRAMLAVACEANRGRERWSRTPFLCANCLAKLFDYPWPSTDYANVLDDADQYLSAPLRAKPPS